MSSSCNIFTVTQVLKINTDFRVISTENMLALRWDLRANFICKNDSFIILLGIYDISPNKVSIALQDLVIARKM